MPWKNWEVYFFNILYILKAQHLFLEYQENKYQNLWGIDSLKKKKTIR